MSNRSAAMSVSVLSITISTLMFMPVSLLTPIVSDLHVTEGQAG
jgi:predicted MFS family arabinose efflux permease